MSELVVLGTWVFVIYALWRLLRTSRVPVEGGDVDPHASHDTPQEQGAWYSDKSLAVLLDRAYNDGVLAGQKLPVGTVLRVSENGRVLRYGVTDHGQFAMKGTISRTKGVRQIDKARDVSKRSKRQTAELNLDEINRKLQQSAFDSSY